MINNRTHFIVPSYYVNDFTIAMIPSRIDGSDVNNWAVVDNSDLL